MPSRWLQIDDEQHEVAHQAVEVLDLSLKARLQHEAVRAQRLGET